METRTANGFTYEVWPHYESGREFGGRVRHPLCGATKEFVSIGPMDKWMNEIHSTPGFGGCRKVFGMAVV